MGYTVKIIPYESKYRDDMLFCYLSAKDVLGRYAPEDKYRKPVLKEDLLDIEKNYLKRGDIFYLAIDERDRVVGMIGTQIISESELWLKRLFIKPEQKSKGVGSKLLAKVEEFAAKQGITIIHTRFANWYYEAAAFYRAKDFVKAQSPEDYLCYMIKELK